MVKKKEAGLKSSLVLIQYPMKNRCEGKGPASLYCYTIELSYYMIIP